MATYSTKMQTAEPYTGTAQVAHCQVCGVQWSVRSGDNADAEGCNWCGAPAKAVTIESEAAGYGSAVVV